MESECTILKIRAGVFLKSDCLSTLNQFLDEHSSQVKPLIYALPYDAVPIKDLATALNVIGQENVLLDLPNIFKQKINALSGFTALEESKEEIQSDFTTKNSAAYKWNQNLLSILLMLVVKIAI